MTTPRPPTSVSPTRMAPSALQPTWHAHVNRQRMLEHHAAIFASDVKSSWDAYAATAQIVYQTLLKAGLTNVEFEPLPADGVTRFGDWIMPHAWKIREGVLLIDDGSGDFQTWARYTDHYDSVIMQSAPARDVHADLIEMDASSPAEWSGRVLFTDQHAGRLKGKAAAAGALGLVGCYHPCPEQSPSSTFWYNTWSDKPGGWFAHAGESKLFGFSLSPEQGKHLREQLKRRKRIPLKVDIDAEFFNGVMPFVSGKIPSEGPRADEEILVCAHLYEHGAHDNASGAATVIELASALQSAISAGECPPPARTLRFLLMPECYGTLGYASLRSERIARTVAGINLDGVGAGRPIKLIGEPEGCDAGLVDFLRDHLEQQFGPDQVRQVPFELADNLLADPLIGVPMVWPWAPSPIDSWHTSRDSLEIICPDSMVDMACAVGDFMLTLAPLKIEKRVLAIPPEKVAPFAELPSASWTPKRLKIGPPALDGVPFEQWPDGLNTSPRWYGWPHRALWRADGRRSLAEIAAGETRQEIDWPLLVQWFEFLEQAGLVELSRRTAEKKE